MRSGRLLAEESPQALLSMYRCSNLEDVFLKLSRKQGTTNAVAELNIRWIVYSINSINSMKLCVDSINNHNKIWYLFL